VHYGWVIAILALASLATACDDGDQDEAPSAAASPTRAVATEPPTAPSPQPTVDSAMTPGPAFDVELLADPQELLCDGVQASTVTAYVTDAGGQPVVDGTTVNFSVQVAGTADPINTNTSNGEAETTVVPLGEDIGVVVNVTAGEAASSIRIDCQ
jgi:hypothetical protein